MDPASLRISQMDSSQISRFNTSPNWIDGRKLLKQEQDSLNRVSGWGYAVPNSYEGIFQSNQVEIFKQALKDLNQNEIYLDIGAGRGQAIMEYLSTYPQRAQVIGIVNTRPTLGTEELIELDKNNPQFQYYLCDILQFSVPSLYGRVSLITDMAAIPAGIFQVVTH